MNGLDQTRVRDLLAEAHAMPPHRRALFLDAACGGDAALRAEVESLLQALHRHTQFLDAPTVTGIAPAPGAMEGVGARVGRYKLLQAIGEGGFGVVYMAEQQSPVVRRVALKLIKPGMDTKQVVARFEAERQALALMDHPGIAKVFDGGATDSGRPYFVMELVRGTPITSYCDAHQLTTAERLGLFVQVCHAVQHAHQKGVIHRDIKPSNVLVTVADGKPVPKVIDFGIAKATQQRLTERTLFTEYRQLVGTPQYMSPEQAEADGIDVDTRSDVYSLGVLLYELLTGTTPFDAAELRGAAYAEMRRIIREVEPPRPSTRLSTLAGDTLHAVASQRKTDARRLGQLVRGDLDWVVMKALEKDRARRYETANALADDVRRHLDAEVVQARPPSTAYRVSRFARKHRRAVAAAAAVALALLLGVAGTTVGLVRAVKEKRNAVEARKAAEQNLARGMGVSGLLSEMLATGSYSAAGGGREVRFADVLERTEARAAEVLKDQPGGQYTARMAIAYGFRNLAIHEAAERNFRRAYEIAAGEWGAGSEFAIRAGNERTYMLRDLKRRDEAVRWARELLRTAEAHLGAGHDKARTARSGLAAALAGGDAGEQVEAEAIYRAVLSAPAGVDPADQAGRAGNLYALSLLVSRQGRAAEAESLVREALAINERLGRNALPGDWQMSLHLARVLADQGKTADAVQTYRAAADDVASRFGPNHPEARRVLSSLANLLEKSGQPDEAAAVRRRVSPTTRPTTNP